MGSLALLSDYCAPETVEVYPPVNYRNREDCFVMIFPEGSRERRLYGFQAVQYCQGERVPTGLHIIEETETGKRGMYWTCDRPDGSICVRDYMGSPSCTIYRDGEAKVIGFAFQYIPDLDGDFRYEAIRGPSIVEEGEERLLFNIVGA